MASRVGLLAVSATARLEVAQASHPVDTPVGGSVLVSALVLGQHVRAGDTLVTLDVQAQTLSVSEERARLAGVGAQLERLQAEIAEQDVHRANAASATNAARSEARARHGEAVAVADLARDQEQRVVRLAAAGLASQADVARARAESTQKIAASEAAHLAIARIDAEQRQKDTEVRIEIERLRRQAAELRAALNSGAAAIDRMRHEGALRRITAPVSGRLAEVANLRMGTVLATGDRVATIVPDDSSLRVVADFGAAEAFGRIRPGQRADVRLDGFPFTQYGSLPAVVANVASELRDGRVRVELTLAGTVAGVPLQHGLPGSVQIEVERLSPAALVLRAAGQRLATSTHTASLR
jgi:multidrug resistance efflux pump